MRTQSALKLVGSIIICQMAGLIGAFFTTSAIPTWYAGLVKPSFSPPNYLFGPVWTILYTLMGISLYLVWTAKVRPNSFKAAMIVFWTQLILNALWSIIFFGLRSPIFAFIVIVMMLMMIALTIDRFQRTSKIAAYLLIPYILWVAFAAVLNLAIVLLN